MQKTYDKHKKGFGVFWVPRGHKHKHKKDKFYARENHELPKRAMMSGESPTSHRDFLDFNKDGRTTPPPTTSKDVSSTTDKGDNFVLAEPLKEHGPTTNFVGIIDGQHKGDRVDEEITSEDKALKDDQTDFGDKHDKDKQDVSKKANGTLSMLDGTCLPPLEKKEEEEKDDCTVKCLYYTLQCCECIVM